MSIVTLELTPRKQGLKDLREWLLSLPDEREITVQVHVTRAEYDAVDSQNQGSHFPPTRERRSSFWTKTWEIGSGVNATLFTNEPPPPVVEQPDEQPDGDA